MNVNELNVGDSLTIDHGDAQYPDEFVVRDTETQDIGLAQVHVAALTTDMDTETAEPLVYALRQVGDDDELTLLCPNSEWERAVCRDDIGIRD